MKTKMEKRIGFWIYLTIILIMILPIFSIDIYLPAFPAILKHFHTQEGVVQSTLSLYLVGYGLFQLVYAPLAERFSAKNILFFGLGIFIVATIACLFVGSIGELLLMRAIQGVGACSGSIIGRVIILDYFGDTAAKAFATIYPFVGMSPLIAPLLGGYLTDMTASWTSVFVALVVIAVMTLIFVAKFIKSEKVQLKAKITHQSIIHNYILIAKNKVFLGYAAMFVGQYQICFIYMMSTPFIFHRLGLSAREIGFMYIPIAASFFTSNQVLRKIIHRFDVGNLLLFGLVMIAIGGVLYLIPLHFVGVWRLVRVVLPMVVILIGCAFLATLGTAGALIEAKDLKNYASALMGFVQLTLGGIITFVVANVFVSSVMVIGVSSLITCFLLLLIFLCCIFRENYDVSSRCSS